MCHIILWKEIWYFIAKDWLKLGKNVHSQLVCPTVFKGNSWYFTEPPVSLTKIILIRLNSIYWFSYTSCTEHKLDRGFTSIFCYMDSHYVQKANGPIEQGERCAYKNIPVRQYSHHKTVHIKKNLHHEMRRDYLSEQTSRKVMYRDGKN